ncbi:spore gernimation protein GerK, partial [Bacillus anthracis]|nr:spore gernimation protein GerK [Bacillus anthracis]
SFADADSYESVCMLFCNWFGDRLGFGYVFDVTLNGMTLMLNACNVIKVWVLQASPWYAILFLFTIACCFIAYNTFKVIVLFYV